MKYILLALSMTVLSSNLLAKGRDSVAFFYKENKVVVLVNDYSTSGRLVQFMEHLNETESLVIEEEDFRMTCSQNYRGAGCRFTFYPSKNTVIANRQMYSIQLLDPEIFGNLGEFSIEFESSMKDKFQLTINENNQLMMKGSKKLK